MPLPDAHANALLDVAEAAVRSGIDGGRPTVDPERFDATLREPRGVFVTLTVAGVLNGCIGTVESDEPLVASVARNAWSAAFADPRLPPLHAGDLAALRIEISLLSPLEHIAALTRSVVLHQLEPDVHGLMILRAPYRGLFLPSVWAQLPDPEDFLDHLLYKAGLTPGSWPRGIRALRFTVDKLVRDLAECRT